MALVNAEKKTFFLILQASFANIISAAVGRHKNGWYDASFKIWTSAFLQTSAQLTAVSNESAAITHIIDPTGGLLRLLKFRGTYLCRFLSWKLAHKAKKPCSRVQAVIIPHQQLHTAGVLAQLSYPLLGLNNITSGQLLFNVQIVLL